MPSLDRSEFKYNAKVNEEERTVDALLSQVAYLKGQLQHYVNENEGLKRMLSEINEAKNL